MHMFAKTRHISDLAHHGIVAVYLLLLMLLMVVTGMLRRLLLQLRLTAGGDDLVMLRRYGVVTSGFLLLRNLPVRLCHTYIRRNSYDKCVH